MAKRINVAKSEEAVRLRRDLAEQLRKGAVANAQRDLKLAEDLPDMDFGIHE
jgi:hypothetical protein